MKRTHSKWLRKVVLACLLAAGGTATMPQLMAQEQKTPPKKAPDDKKIENKASEKPLYIVDEANRRIERALDQKQSIQLVETPLIEVVEQLNDRLAIPILINEPALDDVGIPTDSPITIDLKNVSVRSSLRLMLRSLELTYTIRSGILRITTIEAAEMRLVARVYPVADLVDANGSRDWLVQLCPALVDPQSWEEVGGPAMIRLTGGSLVVSHTAEGQHKVAALLGNLRGSIREPRLASTDALDNSPSSRRLEAAMDQLAMLRFEDVPLSETLTALSEAYDVPIVLDALSLAEQGMDGSDPVTIKLRDVPLHVALEAMLEPLELTTMIRDEVIQVTTLEDAGNRMAVRIYPLQGLQHLELDDLIETVTGTVDPAAWEDVGGPGSIGVASLKAPFLIISQSDTVHRQIARLMHDLRAAAPSKEEQARLESQRAAKVSMEVFTFDQSSLSPKEALELIKLSIDRQLLGESDSVAVVTKNMLIVRHRDSVRQEVRKLLGRFQVVSDHMGGGFGGGGLGGGGLGGGNGGGGFFKVPPK